MYHSNLTSDFWDAILFARNNAVNATVANSYVIDNSANANVVVYDNNYGDTGWWGQAECIAEWTSTV